MEKGVVEKVTSRGYKSVQNSHRVDNTKRAGLFSSLPAELESARHQVLLGIIAKIKGTVRSAGCEGCC